MSEVFLTSDSHFGHEKIIQYCKRPFDSVEEMNETMIENWNEVVRKGDRVYHLGDFLFDPRIGKDLAKRLNGQIYLIKGNHDQPRQWPVDLYDRFIWIRRMSNLRVKGYRGFKNKRLKLALCHYAIKDWNSKYKGALHAHGHSHGNIPDPEPGSLDCGVDCHDFYPIHIVEFLKKVEAKNYWDKILPKLIKKKWKSK